MFNTIFSISVNRGTKFILIFIQFNIMFTIGHACFICEKDIDGGDIRGEVVLDTCRACRDRKVDLSSLSGPALVSHIGAHILHDVELKDSDMPCGFCLNESGLCIVKLIKTSKGTTIDTKNSQCP